MKKIFRVCIALLLCFSLVTPAFALDGIWHNPYGIDDLYDHEPTEIYPLTPIAGEMIYIKSTTWPVEAGQSVWLTYTKNGEPQPDIGAEWKYNSGNNSYWEAILVLLKRVMLLSIPSLQTKMGRTRSLLARSLST